jgi:predicted O-methyltransferase YrrM
MVKIFGFHLNTILKKLFNLKIEKVFPRGFEKFGVKGKDLIGIEIGVYEGEHAISMLKYLSIGKLYLIDPYVVRRDLEDNGKLLKKVLDAKEKAQKIFNNYKNIQLIYKPSLDAVRDIKEKVDFVYIDGDHSYSAVKEDILNYWQILKKGGVLGGHDVHNATRPHNIGVMKAVFEFALSKKLDVYIQGEDWWIKKPN